MSGHFTPAIKKLFGTRISSIDEDSSKLSVQVVLFQGEKKSITLTQLRTLAAMFNTETIEIGARPDTRWAEDGVLDAYITIVARQVMFPEPAKLPEVAS